MRNGRLKSNFLFHITIWRFPMCICLSSWTGLVAADSNNRYYLILLLPSDKKKKGSDRPELQRNTHLGHGPRNNSHNTPPLC